MLRGKLDALLNELTAGIIEKIDFSVPDNEISLKVKVIENKKETLFTVNITKVSSYIYIQDSGDRRFEMVKPDYLELTSIDYYEKGLGDINIDSEEIWVKQYNSNANIAIEIWDSVLLIEAGMISINHENFKLI
ncbi:YxiG family protein [Bacillus sp. SJS]|uniref:YxiG family protein n=1 Tax=Bacillus sp. SJS TaxID=1423321 RepID=UPI0012E8D6AA|nr:hypothetical protein [Bacillus sp. SJS]